MADIMDVYKSLNISTVTVMKNLEMLKFVPDYYKTKNMRKYAVKKLPYPLRYILDQYQTQRMYNKRILENGKTLKPDLTATKLMKCVIKQLIITLMHSNLFQNAIRLKKYVIKLSVLILLQ